jgi:O-antigen ligase
MIGYGLLTIKRAHTRRRILLAVLVSALVGVLAVIGLRHNQVVQNTVFHSDNTSVSTESSNAGRARSQQAALEEVLHEPFGRGPGTAGPASTRNNQPVRIAENYYLQIAQETGWLGLLLLLGIVWLTGLQLWRNRKDELCRVLLASLVGLSFVNLLSHAWADDTLGLMWWGLAGIALAPGILNIKRKQYARTQK